MKKIFVTSTIPELGIKLLKEKFIVDIYDKNERPSKDYLISKFQDYDGIITLLSDPIDKEVIEKCKHLKVISNYAVGFDNVDVITATDNNICVGNTPNTLIETTAEMALALMMSVSRKISHTHGLVKKGVWDQWLPTGHLGKDLQNKTLGIVGMGQIGKAMARKCHFGFNMDIIYTSITNDEYADQTLKAKKVEFNDLLENSDFISVHVNLNESTYKMFNKETFSKIKKNPIFINTTRGGVVDENALLYAIKNNIIWGAGLDVTDPEPMNLNNPLLLEENVIVTPHIASATIQTRSNMSIMAAQNVIAAFEGKTLPGFVNPEVLSKN